MSKTVVVVGGGLAGLSAAYRLAGAGFRVSVFERESVLGGMLASYEVDGCHIEKYYHHLFEGDRVLRGLIEELGLKNRLVWLRATTGYYTRSRVYPLNTPFEILRFPDLSCVDVLRLARFVMRAKKMTADSLDDVSAKEWILTSAGASVYEGFFAPLLKSKFGDSAERVSAAWLLGRVQIRSNRGVRGERLGYLRGGFHQLIEALERRIVDSGGKVQMGCRVDRIVIEDGVSTGVEIGGCFVPCDAVISTVPPFELERICSISQYGVDSGIRYQGTACLLFASGKPLMKDVYWLNIKPEAPFGAVIEHTNLLHPEDYNHEHLIYLTSYFQNPEHRLMRLSSEEVAELYFSGLEELFPDFNRGDVRWWRLFRGVDTAPIYEVGYREKILPYTAPVKGLYLAGMFSEANYPERSMNGSVEAGFAVAEKIMC
jgi:protoporphyrinogen oxidase